ncbi:MAG: folylpolyglutamate synthase/dihydrofolate synthase family protein [Bacteroidota bacterium]|nr:folylpolyglutamate synthase/dihydrofolate synthase family protein [Bacteroidota bacterium]MDP4249765.1 folylpolyglutamate synthase/dihydrofolate synthase family protein [Bacteroidota bacterium]
MFSRTGAQAYKSDLSNILSLSKLLQHPEKKFRSVHIAGTNGKGSTSHMLAAILQRAGYKTGLYTSPHLYDFRERIRINGQMIPESFVTRFTEKLMSSIESIEPSFFEITVAMAFDWFVEQAVDIAVVEVGLGGRLDSTNIILPELSVITNISYDHMDLLGNTLQKIAYEKAGIIKPGIPVIVGEEQAETKEVFIQVAQLNQAPISFASRKRFVEDWKFNGHRLEIELTDKHSNEKKYYSLDLPGIYQTKNIVTVAEAVSILNQRGFEIPESAIHTGLQNVKKITGLHGRWDILHEDPLLVLDVGHNEEGMKEIAKQIELTSHETLHLVVGMVRDKAIENILRHLPKHANYYFTRAQIPRALPESELAAKAEIIGLKGKTFPDVRQALQAAVDHAHPKDLILVCGSVFLAGEVNIKEIAF